MTEKKARVIFVSLAIVSLLLSWFVPNRLVAVIGVGVCVIVCLWVLYRNLAMLTRVDEGNPRLRTVRRITLINMVIILMCVAFSVVLESRLVAVTEQMESYVAAAVVMAVMVFFGNVAPQVPHNRHTGLRLPWTVSDEQTWIVAHRILGYISMPLALFFMAGLVITRNVETMVILVVLMWVGIPGVISGVFFYKKYRGM